MKPREGHNSQGKVNKKKMLPLKLVRSLVLGETINLNHNPHLLKQTHHHGHIHDDDDSSDTNDVDDDDEANEINATSQPHNHQTRRMRTRTRRKGRKWKRASLVFLPTKEIITSTYRLATIARELGFDLFPTPSLSHIIFSNSSSTPSSSSSTPSTSTFSLSSASSSSLNDAVPIPFPSLSTAPLTHLRFFVRFSPRAFKIVLFDSDGHADAAAAGGGGGVSNWDCCSVSLYSRVTGDRVGTMEGFCRVLAGKGWTFFTSRKNPSADQRGGGGGGGGAVYLFRKVDVNRVRVGRAGGDGSPDGACRVRELRLPHLDFENAPLRILQYILLMTDDIFCLG